MVNEFSKTVTSVFPHERIPQFQGQMRYYNSKQYDDERYDLYFRTRMKLRAFTNQDDLDIKQYFKNTEELGPYEKVILRTYLFPDNQLTLILGALGSGKTSTRQFIDKFIEKNEIHITGPDYLYRVYIDLNNEVVDESKADSENQDTILRYISKSIEAAITTTYKDNFHFLWLHSCEIAVKERLVYFQSIANSFHPDNISNKYFIDTLTRYLNESKMLKGKELFQFWVSLLYVHSLTSKEKVRIIIDNIDQIGGYLQQKIIYDLLAYANQQSTISLIVSLRLVSFENIQRNMEFQILPHSGILPCEIIKERLVDTLNEMSFLPTYKFLKDEEKADFFLRVVEIFHFLNKSTSLLCRYISAISGLSIRRAFKICPLLFDEYFDDDKYSLYHLFSTLMNDHSIAISKEQSDLLADILREISKLSKEPITQKNLYSFINKYHFRIKEIYKVDFHESKREKYFCQLLFSRYTDTKSISHVGIENVFNTENGRLTIVKLIILDYLNFSGPIPIREFYNFIKYYDPDPDHLIECINSLSDLDRRLIWFDGKVGLKDMDELMFFCKTDNSISLSETGKNYVTFLIHESIYIENMLLYKKIDSPIYNLHDRILINFEQVRELFIEEQKKDRTISITLWSSHPYFNKKDCPLTLKYTEKHLTSMRNIFEAHIQNIKDLPPSNKKDIQLNEIKTNLLSIINIVDSFAYNLNDFYGKSPQWLEDIQNKLNRIQFE